MVSATGSMTVADTISAVVAGADTARCIRRSAVLNLAEIA